MGDPVAVILLLLEEENFLDNTVESYTIYHQFSGYITLSLHDQKKQEIYANPIKLWQVKKVSKISKIR